MASNQSPTDPDALLSLVERIKEHYQEPPPPPPKRGKKRDFTALSFLLLAAVAMTLRTFGNTELRKLLEKDQRLRQALGFERVPHRTSIGRRLAGLVPEAEQQSALLGQRIVEEVSVPKTSSLCIFRSLEPSVRTLTPLKWRSVLTVKPNVINRLLKTRSIMQERQGAEREVQCLLKIGILARDRQSFR